MKNTTTTLKDFAVAHCSISNTVATTVFVAAID